MTRKQELRTMTVAELRDALEGMPDDKKVVFTYPSHDHWHTVLAGAIDTLDEQLVKWSAYHSAFQLVKTDREEDEANGGGAISVVTLNLA